MRTLVVTFSLFAALPAMGQQQPVEGTTTVTRARPTPEGKNELSAQMGFQGSLGATTPAGFKVNFDYARQLTNLVWLNFKLNPIFGVGPNRQVCQDGRGGVYDCGSGAYAAGHAIDFLAGVKLKFPIAKIPQLIPYAQAALGGVAIFSRPTNDNGGAFVLATGGGVKYFVHKHVGLGGELNFTMGPGWYSQTCANCNNPHTEFYRAVSFAIGAEFVL